MKRDNKGFSLIEMVVVLAIMLVMTGAIMMSVSSLYSQQVKRATRTIDSLLTDTKTLTMAKTSSYFSLRKDGDYYYAETTDGTKKQLSNNKTLTVKYKLKSGTSYIDVATTPVAISYQKSSGAFDKAGSVNVDGSVNLRSVDDYVDMFIISCGNREMKIKLYPKTGKHEVIK